MEASGATRPSASGIELRQDDPSTTSSSEPLSPEGVTKPLEGVAFTTRSNVSSRDNSTTVNDGSSPSHSDKSKQTSPFVPYALTWTEHEPELKPVKPLKGSESLGKTKSVFPRWEHSCTAIPNADGEFIIFGGTTTPEKAEVWTNDVILLSTTDMSFTSLETSGANPKAKTGHRAVIAGRVLVVFGGNVDDSYLHFLNIDTREWSNLRPPQPYPGPRFGHSLIIVDNTIWLWGGGLTGAKLDDMWCIDFGIDGIEYVRWRQIPKKEPWPQPRSYHSTVYHDGCLYIFAGQAADDGDRRKYFNDVWKFEIRTETWTETQCHGMLPQPRTSHTATVIGDNMFSFGGVIVGDKEGVYVRTDHAFAFNFHDHTWRSLAMLGRCPVTTKSGTLLTLESRLVLVGGQTGNKTHIHTAETRGAGYVRDSLAKLQFTTETNKLKFTTEVVDLSRFVRKQGDAAHSLAGFSDVWKGEMTETGKPEPLDEQSLYSPLLRLPLKSSEWRARVVQMIRNQVAFGRCANGNIMEYFAKNPNADRRRLISQVAEGLVYLHGREPPVVHSDIKPANVVVSDEGNAKICDFGISNVMTNKLPYAGALSDPKVIMAIMGGKKPPPEHYPELPATDPLWDVMRECWNDDPAKRPGMVDVFDKLRRCTRTQEA
ncbi:Negative regulator of mitotic exit [Tulasnella sp. 424]|nr:Negative regulator of mitotic exit [Tulasnella sp. 424]